MAVSTAGTKGKNGDGGTKTAAKQEQGAPPPVITPRAQPRQASADQGTPQPVTATQAHAPKAEMQDKTPRETSPHAQHKPGQRADAPHRRPVVRGVRTDLSAGPQEWQAEQPRPTRFLLTSALPVKAQELRAAVAALPDVRVIALVEADAPAEGAGVRVCPPIAVIETSQQRATELAASRSWLVEPDLPLGWPAGQAGRLLPVADPTLLPTGQSDQVKILVRGGDGQPVSGAAVFTHGPWPGYAVTGADGRAVLTLPAGTRQSTTALLIAPSAGYWTRLVWNPDLSAKVDNEITVQALPAATAGNGSAHPVIGWATRALHLDEVPPTHRGHGVKIAVLDSGIATDHPDLAGRITHGANLTEDPAGWDIDPIGMGTATAGIITAAGHHAVAGLVPEAELHAVKTAPGTLADLLRALDYCINKQIDLAQVNVALPTGTGSQFLAMKLADARTAGVTVIAPAGDTSGPLNPPASLPGVVAVGAVGMPGVFPRFSAHAAHLTGYPSPTELMPAAYTAIGPGVDLAAPGVAILTTAPNGGYTVRDSTTLAAAHVTALAAMILAHHDDLTRLQRGAARMDHLHRLLLASCQPLGDRARTGAGIPDARYALATHKDGADWNTQLLQQLNTDLIRVGLLPQVS